MALTQDEYDKLMAQKRSDQKIINPDLNEVRSIKKQWNNLNQSGQPLCIHCGRLEEPHVGLERKCYVTGITRFCTSTFQKVMDDVENHITDQTTTDQRNAEEAERMIGIVGPCVLCTDPDYPSKENHPNGQAEHVEPIQTTDRSDICRNCGQRKISHRKSEDVLYPDHLYCFESGDQSFWPVTPIGIVDYDRAVPTEAEKEAARKETSDIIESKVREVWSRRHDQHLSTNTSDEKCPFCDLVKDVVTAEPGTHPAQPVSVSDLLNSPRFTEAVDRSKEQAANNFAKTLKFGPGVKVMNVDQLHREWDERGEEVVRLNLMLVEMTNDRDEYARRNAIAEGEMIHLHKALDAKDQILQVPYCGPIPLLIVGIIAFLTGAFVMFFAS